MKISLSTYWKCQLVGWSIFSLIYYVFNNIINANYHAFAILALFDFVFGLFFSHLLKQVIDRLGILKKIFIFQILYLTILSIVFSVAQTYVWLTVLVKIGAWTNVSFYKLYFYFLFKVLLTTSGWILIYSLVHYARGIRKQEKEKALYKYQALELEAKALRAQMNPHFIYNCMNSIKALMQEKDVDKGVTYITTFSKLLRTLFQNCDKRQISLYDEIETCRLYTQLEAMRLNKKFGFVFAIDPNLDLKSIMVPALIIQPFIENAIWHGIVPKEKGTLSVTVKGSGEWVICEIDDDGIGREMSRLNKPLTPAIHESKGVKLSQARLDLEKMLNETQATIEIFDKYEGNRSLGTRVVITFNLH